MWWAGKREGSSAERMAQVSAEFEERGDNQMKALVLDEGCRV